MSNRSKAEPVLNIVTVGLDFNDGDLIRLT